MWCFAFTWDESQLGGLSYNLKCIGFLFAHPEPVVPEVCICREWPRFIMSSSIACRVVLESSWTFSFLL